MKTRIAGLISAEANLRSKLSAGGATLLASTRGRSHNEARSRQAIRGIKEMFRKDGLL